jgi:Flp pilus assembly CpaF family ATPase
VTTPRVESLRDQLHVEVSDRLTTAVRHGRGDDRGSLVEQLVTQVLREHTMAALANGRPPMSAEAEEQLRRSLLDAFTGLGDLQPLIDDEGVENIDVNGAENVFVTYVGGRRVRMGPVASSDAELADMLRKVAASLGVQERRFDPGLPRLNLRLPGGHRLAAIMEVSTRPALSIRRPRHARVSLQDLITLGALDDGLAAFLAACVRARKNMVIAGETGSGKTTLLRALAAEIPPDERLITIENALELGLHEDRERHPNAIALEARQANIEGEGELPMALLVQRTLRHNPSRVIVGEVLGDEVVSMLEAMSQGNAGSLCTIHSVSPEYTFRRMAMYAAKSAMRLPVEVTYQMIEGAVDFVVFLHQHTECDQRTGQRRRVRYVASVLEVLEADGRSIASNQIFRPEPALGGRAAPYTPPRCLDDLVLEGYDPSLFHQPEGWWVR